MMLTEQQIEANKEKFLELIRSIEREDFDKEGLEKWLTTRSEFFTAPASARYHLNEPGGLCQHSLNVYNALCSLCDQYGVAYDLNPDFDEELGETEDNVKYIPHQMYSPDTLKILGLLHDISKANLYEKTTRNKKVKNPDGTFSWVSEDGYAVKQAQDRFIYGNHEETSEFMIRSFGRLEIEESVAILYHHAGMGFDSTKADIGEIYSRYPLAMLLHTADMLSSFIIER